MIKINSIPYCQSQWFNISFKSIRYKRKFLKLPGSDFYILFFKEFNKRVKTINELPRNWVDEKQETGRLLSKYIKSGNILSYQSGLSFVENELNKILKQKIFIYEYIDMSKVFFDNPNIVYLNKNYLKKYKFENIILSQMLYDKKKLEIKKLITNLKNIMSQSSHLYIIHSDLRNNNLNIMILVLKFLIKHLTNSNNLFWGYKRSINYYSQLICNEGFSLIKVIKLDHQSLMIFKRN